MGYLLVVGVLLVLSTGGAVALLAGTFKKRGRPYLLTVLGAIGLLVVTGVLIFVTATGAGYSGLAAAHELILATAVALVGAIVLMLKPPRARRVAALLLITVYPLTLFGLGWAGSLLCFGATRWVVISTAQ